MALSMDMSEGIPRIAQASSAERAEPLDEEAFRTFYDRTSRAVWAYLVRVTGDRQLADDLLQEAYYRFHRASAQHEDEAHRRNSLFRIATNLARDAARRRRRSGPWEPLPEEPAGPVDGDACGRAERRTDLGLAMDRLKPAQREMLWLAYAQGMTHEEIAETVGVRTGSVKPLLMRARRKLAAMLSRKGGARDGRR